MGKAGLAVVPIINGFDPTNPDMIDVYSKAGVSIAVGLYQKLRLEGSECKFVLTLPELSNADGAYQHQAAKQFAMSLGVPASDIEFTTLPNRNAIEDVRSAAEHCKNYETHLVVFAPEVFRYFRAVIRGVRHQYPKWRITAHVATGTPAAKPRLRRIYFLLGLATAIAAITGPTFRLFAAIRRWLDRGRLKQWTRTLEEE